MKSLLRRQFKQLTAVVAAIVLAITIVSCSNGSITQSAVATAAGDTPSEAAVAVGNNTLDKIISAGTVRIAVPQDTVPFGSVGSDGQPQGYDVDVAQMLADSLEVELDLVSVDSTNRIPYLQSDRVDLIISSLGANPERAKSIFFSSLPYAPFYSGIYGGADLQVAAYDNLEGYRVGVTKGSLEDLELTKRAPEGLEISRYDDNSTTANALLAGQVELAAIGNIIANKVMADNPNRNLESKFVMNNSPCFIGMRRGDLDLLQWVNVFVMNKRLNGDLDDLSQKWFGEPLELPTF